jgi:hypothetical protein
LVKSSKLAKKKRERKKEAEQREEEEEAHCQILQQLQNRFSGTRLVTLK